MKHVRNLFTLLTMIMLCTLSSCSDGEDGLDGINGIDGQDGADGQDGVDGQDGADIAKMATLDFNLNGLENLGPDYLYEGWIVVDGAPQSTGIFSVNDSGSLSKSSFEVDSVLLANAHKFVLTIEPNPDSDPAPSYQKLIAGDFSGNSAVIASNVMPGVGDFSGASGSFFLRSPTDEPVGSANNGNDQNGIWFGLPGMPPGANFVLPTLPTGWAYEGWVVGDAGPLSTGTFTSFDVMDDNAGSASSFGGTENLGPPLPGEDFFLNAPAGETFPLDIRGRTVVISIEPVPDNSPEPFVLKPLVAISGNDTAPESYLFQLNLESFPSGNVTRVNE
ncbi:anti-sigma factor [Maribacter sp. HTCC2170]|uniref:anti-sigma factor n=1 Tax=Maribacter sp. (strain HTCC2170 / KCCM 42371) TaxID=313603 RepID=UPI00059FF254|nr:anti-sigma factor [Maribacter sp. HTCC2170]